MVARVAIGASLMLAAAGYSGTLAQSRAVSDALLGRWVVITPTQIARWQASLAHLARYLPQHSDRRWLR